VVWVVLAIALAAAGMWDFYQWEYDYGHDLDPSAAIKVPGMSYQPPMFGTKQLLNFRTTAWPGFGGIAAILSVALAAVALAMELWRSRRSARHEPGRVSLQAATLAVAAVLPLAHGCQGGGPRPIDYGVAQCDWCMMTVSDDRYGSEAISAKGRAYVYDSVECLVNAAIAGEDITFDGSRGLYVSDFAAPGTLVDARTAVYLHSEALPSPMGENLTAFASRETAERVRAERGGELIDWAGVREQVTRSAPTELQDGNG
jgi:copper chaperone NosL